MKKYGLIGYPLGHSFSKQYFTEKFDQEKIADCAFENFPISSIQQFPELLASEANLCGLCVTIPYKEQVLAFVNNQSAEVQAIGASNSLKITAGKITAYNTDYIGFSESFAPLLLPHHRQALVLGTGGASKAVQYALTQLNIPFMLVSRQTSHAINAITYQQLNEQVLQEHQLIINCSPSGMHPNENECPEIPYEHITANHYLYDLVYKPAETVFLKKGKAAGALTKNGFDMLLLQAEATWAIWNNPDL